MKKSIVSRLLAMALAALVCALCVPALAFAATGLNTGSLKAQELTADELADFQDTLVSAYDSVAQGPTFIRFEHTGSTQLMLANSSLKANQQAFLQKYSEKSMAQRYYIWKNKKDGTISIQSMQSGLFLGTKNGKLVQVAVDKASTHWKVMSPKTSEAPLYLFRADGKSAVSIAATQESSGKTTVAAGAKALVGADYAAFAFVPTNLIPSKATFLVKSQVQDKYLNLSGGKPYATYASLTAVKKDISRYRQIFSFNQESGSLYSMNSARSTLPIEVAKGSKENGALMRTTYPWGKSDKRWSDQRWTVKWERTGGFLFVNKSSRNVMTIKGAKVRSYAKYAKAASVKKAQHWLLVAKSYKNPAESRAYNKIKNTYSSTKYMIAVDLTNHWLCIYKGKAGSWKPYKSWIISNGKKKTPTVTGDFTTSYRQYSFGHGYTCYYATSFYGDYLFHSIKYHQGTFKAKDFALGKYRSLGCVRMQLENAKWIYKNIPYGTHVKVYN